MSRNRAYLEKLLNKYTKIKMTFLEKRIIKDKRRQAIINSVILSDAEQREIDTFFEKNYGKRISHDWHRLYQSFTGTFQPDYFPELLFSSKLEPQFNSWSYRYTLDDKQLLPLYTEGITGITTPELIGGYSNGVFFDDKRNCLKREDFICYVESVGECVFKKCNDSDSGNGVLLLDGNQEHEIAKVVEQYQKKAFIVQKRISAHKSLSDIYAGAINTFRVVTYIWDGHIYHFPVVLRLGRGGAKVDNIHAGGIFIGVSDDGRLMEAAYNEFGESFYKHPDSGFVFHDCVLNYVPQMLKTAHRMHMNALCLGIISWDITIDIDGNFVLVEANTNGQSVWFPQMANGRSAFGKNTPEILKYLK